MKTGSSKPLPPELQKQMDALKAMPDDQIDLSDAPEVTDWSNATRGALYRPHKEQLTLHLDADLLLWFKKHAPGKNGEGYQTEINRALRKYIEHEERRRLPEAG